MFGDEPEQRRPPGLDDAGGIEQVVQDGQRHVGPETRQHGFHVRVQYHSYTATSLRADTSYRFRVTALLRS